MSWARILAETSITLRDVLDLAPGDLIMTDTKASAPVTLSVEGEPEPYECLSGPRRSGDEYDSVLLALLCQLDMTPHLRNRRLDLLDRARVLVNRTHVMVTEK